MWELAFAMETWWAWQGITWQKFDVLFYIKNRILIGRFPTQLVGWGFLPLYLFNDSLHRSRNGFRERYTTSIDRFREALQLHGLPNLRTKVSIESDFCCLFYSLTPSAREIFPSIVTLLCRWAMFRPITARLPRIHNTPRKEKKSASFSI